MYERLLADPAACWTVRGMAAAVPDSVNVSLDAVRDVFYLLVSQGILRVVPRRYPLTFGITRGGVPPLRRTVRQCKGGGRPAAAPGR